MARGELLEDSLRERLAQLVRARYPDSVNRAARSIGIPQPTLHSILSGRTAEPRVPIVQKIAAHFGVTIDWLLTGSGNAEAPEHSGRPTPHSERALQAVDLNPRLLGQWLNSVPGVLHSVFQVIDRERLIGDYPKGTTTQAVATVKRRQANEYLDRSLALAIEVLILERGPERAREALSRPDVLAALSHLRVDTPGPTVEEVEHWRSYIDQAPNSTGASVGSLSPRRRKHSPKRKR